MIKTNFFHLGKKMIITAVLTLVVTGGYLAYAAFSEPTAAPAASDQDFTENILGANSADNDFDSSAVVANADGSIVERLKFIKENLGWSDGFYGRGWVASTTGDNATTSLTQATCTSAADWEWFEDANGDGDTTDPEDGICVKTTTVVSANWGGTETTDNTYIAAYTCSGSYPTGTVATGPTDCALCVADCYDGRKDLPDQGSYTAPQAVQAGYYGPITMEVLQNWKGTRLPTSVDFFGFCGATTGDTDTMAGDSLYHASGASSNTALGNYGHNIGRGINVYDEYLDLSNSGSYEWLSEQFVSVGAQIAGSYACSYVTYNSVSAGNRFRSVFRP